MSTAAIEPRQRGGIITGWLVRLAVSLLLLGLAFFEAGAVIVARVGVDGTAQTAAREAALVYGNSRDPQAAEAEAAKAARQGGARLVEFTISTEGKQVTVTLERTAKTFVIHKIGPLEKFATTRASDTADVR
ncbi:MAG TPA: hypothetical protein VM841_10685 [Actinomycetota bacterium]|nr:hypothetical protein [Actinomycetota bacterium]